MRKFKLFFACLLMAVLSIGQMWAAPDESVTFSAQGYSNQEAVSSYNGTDFSIAFDKGTNSNAPKYFTSGSAIRAYGGNTMTISSSTKTIKEIAITFGSSDGSNAITTDVATYANGTWTGSASSVTFTIGGSSGNRRLSAIAITYATGGTTTPSLSVAPTSIDFGTVEQGASVSSEVVAVTFANLTGSVTYSGLSGAFSATGNIAATGDEITIAANTANVGNYSQTLTVQSTADSKSAEVTVKMNVVEPFDGLKLTFDVSANPGGWPTTNPTTTTNYTYTLNSTDYTFALNNVKCNSGYLMLTSVAKLGLPAIEGYKLVKVEATNSSGCSTTTQVSVSSSDATKTDVTGGTAQTWGTTSTKYTYNLSGTEENTMYYLWIANKNCQIVELVLYYEEAEAATVAKPTISGDAEFLVSTTVTLECETTGAEIYYTTDGSDPKTSGSIGTSFSLTETKTVRAIAKLGSAWSAEATPKTFTKVTPMTTAAELRSFATSSAQNAFIKLDGWKVTFVNGNNAYMIDPSNEGVILNNASHGYVAGDELNDEVVEASVKLASGRVQLSDFTSTDITATSGTVSPVDVTDFSTISAANQSRLITLKNATYASSTGTFSDGEHLIYFYDQFNANPALVDGATYDVTGVVIYYKNNTTDKVQVAPRTAADVVPTSVIVIPTAANLAALKAAERGTYILTLTNAVVSYVNGKNVFVEEGSTGVLVRLDSHSFEAGNCLNGDYQVTTEDYQGKFEITAIEPQAGAATTTAEIPLTTVSIATLNASFGSYESRRVKIVGANVTDAIGGDDRNGAINDGAAVDVYAAAGKNIITLTANDNVDIIGYPGYYNTDKQLNVWQQSDITVNVKEDPELAYDPTVVNVLINNLTSFTPAQLTYATGFDGVADITYESSNPSIATVETDGTVTLVATEEGSTTITATFAGNSTYKADNASYTINVGAVPTYSMTFNLAKASYDTATDDEVVWNSNVVTITAAKGTATTKPNSYIGGGYNNGNLCNSSRFYKNSTLTLSPATGVSITKVEYSATTASYASALANSSWENASAAVDSQDDKKVIITPTDQTATLSATIGATTGATSIVISYQAETEKTQLTASVAISNINMTIGDEDILLLDINATSNPHKNAISYAITSGSEYVSITGTNANQAFHALADGTATITATIPDDLGNYTGATTTFAIEVSPYVAPEYEIAADPESWTFAAVEQNATVEDKEIAIALTNVEAAKVTLTLEGDGKDAFSVTNNIAAEGKIVISASSETIGTFNATLILSDEDGNAADEVITLSIKVNAPVVVDDLTGTWQLVTDASQLVAGKKVIIASVPDEGAAVTMSTTQATNNRIGLAGATVSEGVITAQNGTAVFTIEAGTEDNTIAFKSSADQYLYAASSGSNYIRSQETNDANGSWIVTISEGVATITAQGENTRNVMRYNPNNNSPIFACYGSTSSTGTLVTLYMKDEATPEPVYTEVRSGLEVGRHYTVCLEKNVTAVKGATFWSLTYKNSENTAAYLVQEEAPFTAGTPYIIQATDDNEGKLEVAYEGDAAGAPVENGALRGTFSYMDAAALAAVEGTVYMLFENALRPIGINNHLDAHRAYVLYNLLTVPSTSNFAPGKKVKSMPLQGQTATGCENIQAAETPVKMMIDGQLFILRGEKMYDTTGRLVK